MYHFSRFIRRPLLPPELLIISLTEACNLRCITCSIKKEVIKDELELDIDKIFSIINQAKEMKIKIIVLSGGEPFLIRDIFKIIEYIKKAKLVVSVTTNGFFNDELIKRIISSCIDHLHFSFDGLCVHHNEIRGRGSFERLMRTVNSIREINPQQSIGFGTVICSKNCNDLFEMTRIADGLRVNTMNFIPFLINNTDPQHSKKGNEHSTLWPDAQDLINLKENFSKISLYRYKHLKIDFNPNFKSLMDYYSLKKVNQKCLAGYKSMIITSQKRYNGRINSEVFFCQDSCGNVYDMSIEKAWHSRKAKQMRLKAKRCDNPCLQFCHYI